MTEKYTTFPPIQKGHPATIDKGCAQCEKFESLLHEILNDQYTDFRQSLADKAHALLSKAQS